MSDRRSFLRGLTTLPLIGGSVALIGTPTSAATPITRDLMWSYKDWLFYEHRMVSYEIAGHDYERYRELKCLAGSDLPGGNWHFQWHGRGPAGWDDAPQPSTRAAVVLSAAGVPLVSEARDD